MMTVWIKESCFVKYKVEAESERKGKIKAEEMYREGVQPDGRTDYVYRVVEVTYGE